MKNTKIRLEKIDISNIKNTRKGTISFPKTTDDEYMPQIAGIYGQNGSGKTAIMYSLYLLKALMSGKKLDKESFNYLTMNEKESNLTFDFNIERKDLKFEFSYNFILEKVSDDDFRIFSEKIVYKSSNNKRRVTLIESSRNMDTTFGNKNKYDEFKRKNEKDKIFELEVEKRVSYEKRASFIFNDNTIALIKDSFEINEINLIEIMKNYAMMNMIVILNDDHNFSTSNVGIPFFFRVDEDTFTNFGVISVFYDDFKVDKKSFVMIEKIIKQLNIILCEIIPGLTLELRNLGHAILKTGEKGVRLELLSHRKETSISIPFKYESDGIKKLVSVLSSLIAMFNNNNVIVAVDEFDSSVFEYLLGEILEIFKESAQGQLIFTSHNLRPLEVLSPNNIHFTTTNPYNRYVQFTNVKETNNLRDLYYREVILNTKTQKEQLNEIIKSSKIRHAFRSAWKILIKDKNNE